MGGQTNSLWMDSLVTQPIAIAGPDSLTFSNPVVICFKRLPGNIIHSFYVSDAETNSRTISIPDVTDFFSVRGDTVPDGTGGTLRAYDVNGQLLGEQTIGNVAGDMFSFSVPGIHRVTFTGSGTIGLDDVTFDPVISTNVSSSFQATIYPAVEIAWMTVAGQNYQVISTPSLVSPVTWTNFGTPIQGDGTEKSVFDKARNGDNHFYRILKVPYTEAHK